MSVFPRSYGPVQNQLVKAAQNLPQTATGTLFTVAGGTVLVQFIAGLVSTAIGATATTLSLGNTPTGGSAANTSLATAAAVTSKAAGTLFVPAFASGIGGAPVIASIVQVTVPAASATAFLVPAGTITWTTSASTTGQMAWYLAWLPLDAGATVS